MSELGTGGGFESFGKAGLRCSHNYDLHGNCINSVTLADQCTDTESRYQNQLVHILWIATETKSVEICEG